MVNRLPTVRDVARFLIQRCNLNHRNVNAYRQPITPAEIDELAAFLAQSEGIAYLYRYKLPDPYSLANYQVDYFRVHPKAPLQDEDRARLITPGYIVEGIYGFDATVESKGPKALVRKLDTRGSIFGVNKGEPFDGELGIEALEGLMKGVGLQIHSKVNRHFFFGNEHPQRSTLIFIEHPLPIDFATFTLDEISLRIAEYPICQRAYSLLDKSYEERLRDLLNK